VISKLKAVEQKLKAEEKAKSKAEVGSTTEHFSNPLERCALLSSIVLVKEQSLIWLLTTLTLATEWSIVAIVPMRRNLYDTNDLSGESFR